MTATRIAGVMRNTTRVSSGFGSVSSARPDGMVNWMSHAPETAVWLTGAVIAIFSPTGGDCTTGAVIAILLRG